MERTGYISEFGAFDLNNVVQQGAGMFISKIIFNSNLLPEISVDDPFGANPSTSGEGTGQSLTDALTDGFLKLLKPKVTVYTTSGPVSVAPFGEPHDPGYWPFLVSGLLIVGALAVYGGYKFVRGGK